MLVDSGISYLKCIQDNAWINEKNALFVATGVVGRTIAIAAIFFRICYLPIFVAATLVEIAYKFKKGEDLVPYSMTFGQYIFSTLRYLFISIFFEFRLTRGDSPEFYIEMVASYIADKSMEFPEALEQRLNSILPPSQWKEKAAVKLREALCVHFKDCKFHALGNKKVTCVEMPGLILETLTVEAEKGKIETKAHVYKEILHTLVTHCYTQQRSIFERIIYEFFDSQKVISDCVGNFQVQWQPDTLKKFQEDPKASSLWYNPKSPGQTLLGDFSKVFNGFLRLSVEESVKQNWIEIGNIKAITCVHEIIQLGLLQLINACQWSKKSFEVSLNGETFVNIGLFNEDFINSLFMLKKVLSSLSPDAVLFLKKRIVGKDEQDEQDDREKLDPGDLQVVDKLRNILYKYALTLGKELNKGQCADDLFAVFDCSKFEKTDSSN